MPVLLSHTFIVAHMSFGAIAGEFGIRFYVESDIPMRYHYGLCDETREILLGRFTITYRLVSMEDLCE